MFYAGHRKYLNNGKSNANSSIDPPKEFLSRKQLRVRMLKERERDTPVEEKKGFIVNFQKKHDDEGKSKFKKVANLVKKAHIASEHPVIVHREEWEERLEAGVKIWVNKLTGDAWDECPWKDPEVSKQQYKSPVVLPMNRKRIMPQNDSMAGTGALVYDGHDVQDLFQMLDDAAAASRTRK